MRETRASRIDRLTITGPPTHARASHRKRPARPCPCGCGTAGLCESHKARLHQIRDSMIGGHPNSHNARNTTKHRGYRPPACCLPDCGQPRTRGQTYCVEHAHLEEHDDR